MKIEEYIVLAKRTLNNDLTEEEQNANLEMGLFGETGEVVDIIKKHKYQGHSFEETQAKLKNELGDVFWYLANRSNKFCSIIECINKVNIEVNVDFIFIIHFTLSQYIVAKTKNTLVFFIRSLFSTIELFDLDFEEILEQNIDKLKKRYPEGFSEEKSRNRD